MGHDNYQIMNIGFAFTHVYGPVIPPEMQWRQAFEMLLPRMFARKVLAALTLSPFHLVMMNMSLGGLVSHKMLSSSVNLDDDSSVNLDDDSVPLLCGNTSLGEASKRRPVARVLTFNDLGNVQGMEKESHFVSTPVSVPKKRGRPRKVQVAVVEPANRRFTRTSLKLQGFRPKPIIEKVKPMKARAKFLLQQLDRDLVEEKDDEHDQTGAQESQAACTPETPIPVMQRVGRELGIAPKKLTKESLEAAPKGPSSSSADD
jgi:hypothetical protein